MSLAIDNPVWLLALLLVPWLMVIGRRSFAGLGTFRDVGACLLRLLVFVALVLALAETRIDRHSDVVNVAYLLDQSESIPAESRAAMRRLVVDNIASHRRDASGDRAAVVVFGREASVEIPPVDFTPPFSRVESFVDATATNVADAIRTADAILPSDGHRRVVLVSDGNENVGTVAREAAAMAYRGLSIDVIATPVESTPDVAVESVWAPAIAKRHQPFEVRVVLHYRNREGKPVTGTLRIVRKDGDSESVISEQAVTLSPGKEVYTVRQELDAADFYTYEARFIADDPGDDTHQQNNFAAGFVDVHGPGRVLLIEDHEHLGEFKNLTGALRDAGIDVDVRPSYAAFDSLADLQRYDSVLLANLPRTSGDAGSQFASLTENQVELLVQNTEKLGCGLVMIGGDRALGAGGWADTPLEAAMPVDFKIKNAKVVPTGALALVIDKSGSMQGQKLHLAIAAARGAIGVLGPRDYVTVIAFDEQASAVAPLKRVGNGSFATRRVARLWAGGGTDLRPAMELARSELRQATDASERHVIVLSDGQTSSAGLERIASALRLEDDVSVTTVAVGPDADTSLLSRVATRGGGRFYAARSPSAVPRIFIREAMRVARPVVKRLSPPQSPAQVAQHEILKSIQEHLPPIAGFVQTTVKDSPLVEVLLQLPDPARPANSTVLATWSYGVGKTAVLTTDAGHNWASSWTGWPEYRPFFAQLVRWSMRPSGGEDDYLVSTEQNGKTVRVLIDSLGEEAGQSSIDLATGTVVGPDGEAVELDLQQVAARRLLGEFSRKALGTYFISVTPRLGGPTLRAGVSVTNSAEYADDDVNIPLLARLVNSTPPEGEAGRFVEAFPPFPFVTAVGDAAARELDPFRRDQSPLVISREAWPLMVLLASLLFAGDVAWRRISLDIQLIVRWLNRFASSQEQPQADATLRRLQSRKREVREQLETNTSTLPWSEDSTLPLPEQNDVATSDDRQEAVASEDSGDEADKQATTYTSRLLAAKRAATSKFEREP